MEIQVFLEQEVRHVLLGPFHFIFVVEVSALGVFLDCHPIRCHPPLVTQFVLAVRRDQVQQFVCRLEADDIRRRDRAQSDGWPGADMNK